MYIFVPCKALGKSGRLEWRALTTFFSLCISLCPGFHFELSYSTGVFSFFENLGQTNLKVCHMKGKTSCFPHPQISFHDNLLKKTFCQLIKRGKRKCSWDQRQQEKEWKAHQATPLMQKMDAAKHCVIFMQKWSNPLEITNHYSIKRICKYFHKYHTFKDCTQFTKSEPVFVHQILIISRMPASY